ncbi:(2Fe-2S)-binding protein [Leekyejoonella antrihumi]|uniref:(2Fe-2S)-binding protein n=1 Tax=Leekyejoonella antrihumi TaxID=1660198 RepID=A0A563DS61_9MICO|nr:(2Fe-2S)-binding protein [Leekyejoonella antrihumi]TWP32534.1 (2Fe-2S)-binding protein [Leekyejoonella antrihumi]
MTCEQLHHVSLIVNGVERSAAVPARTLLSDFLRHELGLFGTHVGCEQGVCGACTVLIGGRLARSCTTFAVQVQGEEIRTVEGLANGDELHPIQESFRRCHGLQCGFCTPGFLMATEALLSENDDPSDSEIRDFLSGNVCRCTGYVGIVASVKDAALRARGVNGSDQ